MVGGKAASEAGAETHGAVRCCAWLGDVRFGFISSRPKLELEAIRQGGRRPLKWGLWWSFRAIVALGCRLRRTTKPLLLRAGRRGGVE